MIASEEVDRQLENDAMPYLFDNYYTRDVYHFAMEQTRQTKNRLEKFSKFAEMLDPRKRRERGAHRNQVNRIIQLNDSDSNKHFGSNVVRSAKYNIYNVVPKFFYEQLTRLANIYFLVTGILYLVDAISPTKTGSRYGQIISFTAVITITAIKEAYEDFWRHREDFRLNRNEATVIGSKGSCRWGDLRVGDIVRLDDKETVPADIILLAASSEDGLVYVETKQLDGESNLKVKVAPARLMHRFGSVEKALGARGTVECDAPNARLYEFYGVIRLENEDPEFAEEAALNGKAQGVDSPVAISLPQFLPRGCRLRNTQWIFGLVVNTGKDTKIGQNLKKKPKKRSTLDRKLDKMIAVSMFVQFVVCGVLTILSAAQCQNESVGKWYLLPEPTTCNGSKFALLFLTYIVLTSSFVPLALYVSMEISRLIQSTLMVLDDTMLDPGRNSRLAVRTSNLNEECGMISYLFSDKTGTLTSNEMVFKKFVIDGTVYSHEPQLDEDNGLDADSLTGLKDALVNMNRVLPLGGSQNQQVEFFRLLALCNSVVIEDGHYVGTSPDEVSLVAASKDMGYEFVGRSNKDMSINVCGKVERWDLLGVLEFNSSRKRMSVIVRSPYDGTIRIYCKGADFIIFRLLEAGQEKDIARLKPILDRFAATGLRTLCMSYREVELDEFTAWYKEFANTQTMTEGREEALEKVASRIETNMKLLGSSAIEDMLQTGVPETLQKLELAGIRTWILTGDKQETAINIGVSCGILNNVMTIEIINEDSKEDVEAQLDRVLGVWRAMSETMNRDHTHFGLVIDGHTLQFILNTDLENKLVLLGKKCKTVLACRVSPKQKTMLVEAVRRHDKHRVTMAVGDGANDVGMIQAAHVGVGIFGVEGVEAKLASDFSFTQFRYLQRLVLVHGRWNYKRMAKMSLYIMYKSIASTSFDVFFSFYNGLSGQLFTDPLIMGLYNICLTAVPVIVFSGWDRDLSAEYAIMFPECYKRGQTGYAMSLKVFMAWASWALYHGVVAFFIPAYVGFNDPISNGRTIGLSGAGALTFLINLINVNLFLAVYVSSWNVWTFLIWFFFTTFFFYGGLLYTSQGLSFDAGMNPLWLNTYQEVFSSATSWLIILLCVGVAIVPVHMFRYYSRNYHPHEKILVQELMKKGKKRSDIFPTKKEELRAPVLDRRGTKYPLRDLITFDVDDAGGGLHDRFNPAIGIMNRHRRMKRTLSDSDLLQNVFTDKNSALEKEQTKHKRNITVGF